MVEKLDPRKSWDEYKKRYGLSFDETEDRKRFEIFTKNEQHIRRRNEMNLGFTLAMNQLGHLEPHEVPKCKMNITQFKQSNKAEKPTIPTGLPLPVYVDWRNYGVVAPVKDQKRCGSCYAFSAIGATESHFAIIRGNLTLMSEQEIVDCSIEYGNQGCDGGEMQYVFRYIMDHGISTSQSYPYVGVDQKCVRKSDNNTFHLKSFVEVPTGNEQMLQRAIAFVGPISIAIDANHNDFMFYSGGILNIPNCSSTDLDHGVLAVGYSMVPVPHIIVKNSWGTEWGEFGYVRMPLFKDNQCGIATDASYPIPQ